MFEIALGQAADPERILLESTSRTTWENARFSATLLRQHGWHRVLLVSDAWHLPRALIAFRAAGVTAQASAPRAFDVSTAGRLRNVGRESLALPWYLMRVLVSRPPR